MGKRISLIVSLVGLCLGVGSLGFDVQAQTVPWWNAQWRYRVPVVVQNSDIRRTDKVISVQVNFGQLLTQLGDTRTFNPQSVRVVDSSGISPVVVPFQFDLATGSAAGGEVVFQIPGNVPVQGSRTFQIYFESATNLPAPQTTPPLVTVTDVANHEGQASFKVATVNGTYYYHKQGAGFASMEDPEARDWLGYHPTGGSAGDYRGIPNMGLCCHPGYPTVGGGNFGSTSTLVYSGPLRARVRSVSSDNAWDLYWDFFPQYATVTITKIGTPFWFLYEGTPGGGETIQSARDFYVLADGTRKTIDEVWNADFANPEWLYFGDTAVNRVLFLVHHEDDQQPDSYRPMEGNMTVFGFGRRQTGLQRFMNTVPAHFTVGFAAAGTHAQVQQTIEGAYKPMTVSLGTAEKASTQPTSTPQPTNTPAPANTKAILVAWFGAAKDTTGDQITNMMDWLQVLIR